MDGYSDFEIDIVRGEVYEWGLRNLVMVKRWKWKLRRG